MTDLFTFTTADGVTVGALRGDVRQLCDATEAERAHDAFQALLADPASRRVALDLTPLEYPGANFNVKILVFHKNLQLRGGRLAVCGSKPLIEIYQISQIAKVIPVHDNLAAAVAAVRPVVPRFLTTAWLDGVLVVRFIHGWRWEEEDLLKREIVETLGLTAGPPDMVLDLADLKDGDMGTVFLASLHPLIRAANERAGHLRLTNLTPGMRDIMDTVDRHAQRYVLAPSVAAAVAELAGLRVAASQPEG